MPFHKPVNSRVPIPIDARRVHGSMKAPRAVGPVQALFDEIVAVQAAGSSVAVTLQTGFVVRLTGSLAADFLDVFRTPAHPERINSELTSDGRGVNLRL